MIWLVKKKCHGQKVMRWLTKSVVHSLRHRPSKEEMLTRYSMKRSAKQAENVTVFDQMLQIYGDTPAAASLRHPQSSELAYSSRNPRCLLM